MKKLKIKFKIFIVFISIFLYGNIYAELPTVTTWEELTAEYVDETHINLSINQDYYPLTMIGYPSVYSGTYLPRMAFFNSSTPDLDHLMAENNAGASVWTDYSNWSPLFSDGVYSIAFYEGETLNFNTNEGFSYTGRAFYISYSVVDGEIVLNNPYIPTADNFETIITLPDETIVTTNYDYINNDFGDISISLFGNNFAGLYDTFYIDIYEDGVIVVEDETIPISLSCINCELGSFLLSDFYSEYRQGHKYFFEIVMGSIISDPIKKQFTLYFNLVGEQVNYEECATGDITCYIRNSLRWATFVPPSTFDKFLDLRDEIQEKPPFGYLTSAYNAVLGINNTDTPEFVLQEVTPIKTNIFDPIRTGLSWFFYFLFVFSIIKRFKEIQL